MQDDSVFPCPEGEHVDKLWYSSSNTEKSAKVDVLLSLSKLRSRAVWKGKSAISGGTR